jgi:hypothetical protein
MMAVCCNFIRLQLIVFTPYGSPAVSLFKHKHVFSLQHRLYKAAFFKLWSADHKWSSGSALVVLLDWTLVQKRQNK